MISTQWSDVDKKPGDKRYDPFRVEDLPTVEVINV
jgi:hypothetical protein